MKNILSFLLLISLNFSAISFQQAKSPDKNEIKKDAKEVAGGAKQIWDGVKSGGRTVGHKSKKVAKTIGYGAKDVTGNVKKDVKK
ncbi:MAG: hypothetical protein NTV09_07755 [Bacteroidetes bacterium]|nr:hypothetical protein [Bacteroidota bacterium]